MWQAKTDYMGKRIPLISMREMMQMKMERSLDLISRVVTVEVSLQLQVKIHASREEGYSKMQT